MSELTLDTITFDTEGFMEDANAWTPKIAHAIAKSLDIELTDRHFVVINYSRKIFFETDDAPTLRKITKQTNVNTKELYKLFPGGPAKVAAKIAGLKKPTGCI